MSGALTSRVNRVWDNATQANVTCVRFFWEWLNYIDDHKGLTVVEVGIGTTSLGSTIPAEWLAWNGTDLPSSLSPQSLDANAWVVFRAIYADALLNGGGTMPWEAKIQMAYGGTTYSDPSGTDYGKNGQSNTVVLRSCPAGGWVGTPTWDFAPGGGEEPSQDLTMFQNSNHDYFLDIMGDDDTILWRGVCGDFPGDSVSNRTRSGYLGMTQRRSADITWPFFMTCGRIYDDTSGGGERAIDSKWALGSVDQWSPDDVPSKWPSYSVSYNGDRVDGHVLYTWNNNTISRFTPYQFGTPTDIFPYIMYREHDGITHFDILGELRLMVTTDQSKAHSVVFGDNLDWIQICSYNPTLYGGIAMKWPDGVVPIW